MYMNKEKLSAQLAVLDFNECNLSQ